MYINGRRYSMPSSSTSSHSHVPERREAGNLDLGPRISHIVPYTYKHIGSFEGKYIEHLQGNEEALNANREVFSR